MATAKQAIDIALGEVGYDRYNDPSTGTKYGRWYAQGHGSYYGESGVPFCAMFCSWVLDQAGVSCDGFPSAYCPDIHNHQSLTASQLKYGDVVLFDWGNDGVDDHVGFVISNDGWNVHTVEGNVSNGKVLERDRSYSTICGGIRPDYSDAETPIGVGMEDMPPYSNLVLRLQHELNVQCGNNLAEDGLFGPLTYAAASRANAILRQGDSGNMTRILQQALVGKGYPLDIDGKFGPQTREATMSFQRKHRLLVDGEVGGETWATLLA